MSLRGCTPAHCWLFKTEPAAFSIADLRKRKDQTEHWDGVRNFQARNFMRDEMQVGDQGFIYHSSCAEPSIVGIIDIVRPGYPDFTAFDPIDPHYDPKSTPQRPIWYMVDVRLKREFHRPITLRELKTHPPLGDMRLLARGNRLSVMPVERREWEYILNLAGV
ncbi:MAG: EVE domain-containing protein [Acidiferrobacterales bacterium]